MNWIEGLLDPLLDRLALRLAGKIRAQLNGAIDASLDRVEDRAQEVFEGLEERLLASANKAMEDVLQRATGPALVLQQQIEALAPEQMQSAAGMVPVADVKAAISSAAAGASAAAADHLRSRLQPPRPWLERPDR